MPLQAVNGAWEYEVAEEEEKEEKGRIGGNLDHKII